MNTFNKLTIANTLLLLILIATGIVYFINANEEATAQDIAYVDNIKLFNEFNMTKDIKAIEEKKMTTIKTELDSIYAIYQSLKNKTDNQAKQLESQLNAKSQTLKTVQDNYTNNLSQQVWSRLNDYIKTYATENKTKIILGTSGNGNLMHGEESLDITASILHYSNNKYEGSN